MSTRSTSTPVSRLEPRTEKQFDFATDLVKQLITLATGVIALTVTFLHDILGNVAAPGSLKLAWVLYLVSILAGIIAMMALTAELTADAPTIVSSYITIPAAVQVVMFLVATASTLAFGWSAYVNPGGVPSPTATP